MSIGRELIDYIQNSATCFQAVEAAAQALKGAGFCQLRESQPWELTAGGRYYVCRNQSSILAFMIPEAAVTGFQIGAAHSDSPTFRVKPNMELVTPDHYVRINTEPYGGGIYASWLDRPLSVAGRVMVETEKGVEARLVKVDRDLLVIPHVAIHMNRQINSGYTFNPQTDMMPLFSGGTQAFRKTIAEAAGCPEEKILSMDLFLYNRTPGILWGSEEEFVSAPRLDDLQCGFALLKGFLAARPSTAVPVYALFDNEEVGSLTRQGADSTFLQDTLHRIAESLEMTESAYLRCLAASFLVSADNAHAVHPNHPEFSDALNRCYMNGGPVIKFNGNQKYTSDALSEALFRRICRDCQVPVQTYTNRSDMAGGSTLGNLNNRHVSLKAVDIGLPQLAMHSCYETAGTRDTQMLVDVMKNFYSLALIELSSEELSSEELSSEETHAEVWGWKA